MAIFKRNGKWYIDYYFKGQRIRECIGSNKKAAQEALTTRKAEILQDRFKWQSKKAAVSFEDFARNEYLPLSKDKNRPRSYKRNQLSVRHLCDFFGKRSLSSITVGDIERYRQERRNGKNGKRIPSVSTVNRELACLKTIFNIAIKRKRTIENPVTDVDFYKEPKESMRILSRDEEKKLIPACPEHLRYMVLTALNTGMRKGEILNLTWDKVDLRERLITVDHTKSGDYRVIPINKDLTNVLKCVKKRGEHVFCRENGEPYGDIKTAFNNAIKRAGIPHIRFHDLRHPFATRYMEKGDVVTLKDILGHKTIEMTMRYAHPTLEKKRWSLDVLNVTLDGHQMDTKAKIEEKQISVSY